MTGRDRIVAIAVGVIVVLAAVWIMVVSPKRKEAGKLGSQISTAQSQLSTAEQQLASARAAEAQYPTAYASMVSVGKAVPAGQEVPSLIYQLEQASSGKHVDFSSITASSTAGAGSTAGGPSPAAASSSFTAMPFTFIFNGTFFDLEHLFGQLDGFTTRTASGALEVNGRLLTIQSIKLVPGSTGGGGSSEGHKSGPQELTGTITATAYVLPAGQSAAGAGVPGAPGSSSTPASPAGAPTSPAAPAVARVTP